MAIAIGDLRPLPNATVFIEVERLASKDVQRRHYECPRGARIQSCPAYKYCSTCAQALKIKQISMVAKETWLVHYNQAHHSSLKENTMDVTEAAESSQLSAKAITAQKVLQQVIKTVSRVHTEDFLDF